MLKLPPPFWALVYVVLGAVISGTLGWPRLPGMPVVPLGITLTLLGWIPPVWAVVLFRRAGAELNPISPENKSLVIAGPYAFTRNPMYLGLTIITLGIAVWNGSWPLFLAPVAVFATANWVHIPFEEDKMRRQFGLEFDAYAHKVRRWI